LNDPIKPAANITATLPYTAIAIRSCVAAFAVPWPPPGPWEAAAAFIVIKFSANAIALYDRQSEPIAAPSDICDNIRIVVRSGFSNRQMKS
jgi:hypothetical protein